MITARIMQWPRLGLLLLAIGAFLAPLHASRASQARGRDQPHTSDSDSTRQLLAQHGADLPHPETHHFLSMANGPHLNQHLTSESSRQLLSQQAATGHMTRGSKVHHDKKPSDGPLADLFACSVQLLAATGGKPTLQRLARAALLQAIDPHHHQQMQQRRQQQEQAATAKGTAVGDRGWARRTAAVAQAAMCVASTAARLGWHQPCGRDPELLAAGLPPDLKVLLGAALKNQEHVMPQMMMQILRIVLPASVGQVVVSLSEGGSTDTTPSWLAVIDHVMQAVGVTAVVEMSGDLRPLQGEMRIPFLARVRNHVLQPLWSQAHPWIDPGGFKADKVVFLNDVFFCAQDVLRLLRYQSADIACGMDFVPRDNDPGDWRFYDTWVMRDISGNMMTNRCGEFSEPGSLAAAKQGWPVPVHCCWNGLAVLNAKPFRDHGLRFRSGRETPGECEASECTLLCMDYQRLGYGRFLVDPSVRVLYKPPDNPAVKEVDVPCMQRRNWTEVRAHLVASGQADDTTKKKEAGQQVEEDKGRKDLSGEDDPGLDAAGRFWDPRALEKMQITTSATASCCGLDSQGELDWRQWSSCKHLNMRTGHNYTADFIKQPKPANYTYPVGPHAFLKGKPSRLARLALS